MATLDTIVTAIVAVVGAVAGISNGDGKAVKYFQYTPGEKDFISTYVSNGKLNAWIVTRDASEETDRGAGAVNVRDKHSIVIYGFRPINAGASSEQDHQDLTEAVRLALRQNRRLPNDAGFITEGKRRVEQVQVMWAGRLCWRAKIMLVAEETRQGG